MIFDTFFKCVLLNIEPNVVRFPFVSIHVIFSWAQIGRSAIFGREIGVPDREIFSRQKKNQV